MHCVYTSAKLMARNREHTVHCTVYYTVGDDIKVTNDKLSVDSSKNINVQSLPLNPLSWTENLYTYFIFGQKICPGG